MEMRVWVLVTTTPWRARERVTSLGEFGDLIQGVE